MFKEIALYFLLIFAGIYLQAQEQKMTEKEIINLKKEVKLIANEVKTITSDFIQYKHLDFLANDIIAKGKMTYKSPKLIKWQYIDPYRYAVVFKSDKLLINDDGKKSDVKIGSNTLFKKLNELIVNSINGDMFDEQEFSILYAKTSSFYIVKFTSKDKDLRKYIKQFVLHFNKSFRVAEVKMVEPTDDYTRLVFNNRKENLNISDALFTN